MRIPFLLFFIAGMLFHVQAQTDTLIYMYGDSTHIDVQPQFPGGDPAFNKFIQTFLIYPEDAVKDKVQGMVYVSFIIEKDGSVSTIKVLQGKYFSASCEKAAMDVISKSPRWKPGLKISTPVRTKKVSRIRFDLGGTLRFPVTANEQHLKKISEVSDTTVFKVIGIMPEFMSTNGSLYTYIKKNLIYPADAQEKKITGSVIVSFVVEKDGSVSNAAIVPGKGLYPSCDQAALDLVSGFPAWNPGEHDGKYYRVQQMVRITFE